MMEIKSLFSVGHPPTTGNHSLSCFQGFGSINKLKLWWYSTGNYYSDYRDKGIDMVVLQDLSGRLNVRGIYWNNRHSKFLLEVGIGLYLVSDRPSCYWTNPHRSSQDANLMLAPAGEGLHQSAADTASTTSDSDDNHFCLTWKTVGERNAVTAKLAKVKEEARFECFMC
jgi:hypothetical protein